jgi:hypothetical protein
MPHWLDIVGVVAGGIAVLGIYLQYAVTVYNISRIADALERMAGKKDEK